MKQLFAFATIVALQFFASESKAQTVTLTGPTSESYCDLESILFNASAELYDSDGDEVDFRYRFTWYRNGAAIATKSNGLSAHSTLTSSDYDFQPGSYNVKLDIQIKYGLIWVTSQSINSNYISLSLHGMLGSYDAAKVAGRMVSGDFDRDGKEDDVAALYDYGSATTKIHVWKSDAANFSYAGDGGWWSSTAFDASKTTSRVISGDFDRDGFKDDIAAFYDYGSNHTEVHVWTSTGTGLNYAGVWWSSGYGSSGYNVANIAGRIVSGDFDRDGYEDDICMFYDYGSLRTEAHIMQSTGSAFTFSGAWFDSGVGNFEASRINGKVVSGDFDRDGYKDDVTAIYAHSGSTISAFTWLSAGTTFSGPYTWYAGPTGNFDGNQVTSRVVSGDFDRDGYKDDITAFYQYNDVSTKGFVWQSTGTNFSSYATWYSSGAGNFNANMIAGTVVAGDFDNDGKYDDITALYDYQDLSCRFFTWKSTGSSFSPIETMWEVCAVGSKPSGETADIYELEGNADELFTVYPNPTSGVVQIKTKLESVNVEILGVNGAFILSRMNLKDNESIDLTELPRGIYYVKITSDNLYTVKKLIRE